MHCHTRQITYMFTCTQVWLMTTLHFIHKEHDPISLCAVFQTYSHLNVYRNIHTTFNTNLTAIVIFFFYFMQYKIFLLLSIWSVFNKFSIIIRLEHTSTLLLCSAQLLSSLMLSLRHVGLLAAKCPKTFLIVLTGWIISNTTQLCLMQESNRKTSTLLHASIQAAVNRFHRDQVATNSSIGTGGRQIIGSFCRCQGLKEATRKKTHETLTC